MSLSAFSISERGLPDGQGLSAISALGDLAASTTAVKKDVEKGWVKDSIPVVDRGSPPA